MNSCMEMPILATVSRLVNKQQQLEIEYLCIENKILRKKLGESRLKFTDEERISLAKAAKPLNRKTLDRVVNIAKPETILKWFRQLVKNKWNMSERRKKRNKPGRPFTQKEIRNLVLDIATDNNWGYKKIQGELAQLGIEIDKITVRNILRSNGLPTSPERKGKSWRQFLAEHANVMLSADFLTQEVMTFCGLKTAYILIVMHLKSRTMLMCEATYSPHSRWMEQQARNISMIAEKHNINPKYLIHDRDTILRHSFDDKLKLLDIKPILTPVKSPNLNAHAERMIRSIKEECLDHLIIFGIERLRYVLNAYRKYFNTERPHQGLNQRTPEQVLKNIELPKSRPKGKCNIETISHLGGLLKSYRWKDVA